MIRSRLAVAACVVALAGAVSGCLDFVEPTPGPGQLEVVLTVTDEDPVRSQLTATFDPGGDPDGDFRTVEEPSIRVAGRTIEPARVTREVPLQYRDDWTLATELIDRSTLDVEGPLLEPGRPRLTTSVPLLWRSGPRSLELEGDEDLVLPLRGADAATEGIASWLLVVRKADSDSTRYLSSSTGSLPDTVRVQGEVFSGLEEPETMEARLEVDLRTSDPARGPFHRTSVRLLVRLVWQVSYDPGDG